MKRRHYDVTKVFLEIQNGTFVQSAGTDALFYKFKGQQK